MIVAVSLHITHICVVKSLVKIAAVSWHSLRQFIKPAPAQKCTCTYVVRMYACTAVRTMHVCIVRMYACAHVCMHVCMRICVHYIMNVRVIFHRTTRVIVDNSFTQIGKNPQQCYFTHIIKVKRKGTPLWVHTA